MLPRDIELRFGDDVFTRPEVGGRVFLQRPAGRDGHLVRLVRQSASVWSSRIETGVRLDELLAESTSAGQNHADLEAFVASLIRDGFIPSAPSVVAASHSYAAEVPLFEDPWAFQFSQPSLSSPWFVLWEVTDKCSQHCTHCYNPPRANVQVGLGQAQKVVDELVRNRIPYVTLLGGEPLSNVHIEEIIRLLSSNRIYTKIITSGVPITPLKVQRLKEAGLNQVALSLDALTPELNDLTRGPQSFHHFAKARKALGREIPCVSLSLTVSSATLAQLDQLGDFCREWDVDDVYLSQLRAVDSIEYKNGVHPLRPDEITEMNRKADQLNAAGTKIIVVKQCSCGRSSAVIEPNGTMRACPFTPAPAKNGFEGDLAMHWASVARKAEVVGPQTSNSECFRSFCEEAP